MKSEITAFIASIILSTIATIKNESLEPVILFGIIYLVIRKADK